MREVHPPILSVGRQFLIMARTKSNGTNTSTATIGFEVGTESRPELQFARAMARFVLASPPFNDSDTALRDSAFLQTGGTLQVMAEREDNFRKDDDVRWQKCEQHICNL